MPDDIGWHFPPTNGGQEGGYNDSGIAHFRGAPIGSLARETIQNSLDAHDQGSEPVEVSFEVRSLLAEAFGLQELRQAIESCHERADTDEDRSAVRELTLALELLEPGEVAYLRISDQNTTGLTDRHWKALVKMQGLSVKQPDRDALGSHGQGKYAPFAVSPLRTVFYWTAYHENSEMVEKLQGKSVLMTHEGPDGPTQGTGFYGYRDGCRELALERIPSCFRVLDQAGEPKAGTSLFILGFSGDKGWQRDLAGRVLVSFFHAVRIGKLETTIEPDDGLQEHDLLTIDRGTIGAWFDYLIEAARSGGHERDLKDLAEARVFWQLPEEHDQVFEKQDQDLGHCRLYLRIGEGLPSRVALVRRSGMLVTTDQQGLKRFPGFEDFAALCVFEDPAGNELLRDMENPQHNQFEPDFIRDRTKRIRGRAALKRVTAWIRDEIRTQAKPPETAATSAITEVAELLPDPYAEDDLGGGATGDGIEKSFTNRIEELALKPIRRRPSRGLSLEAAEADANAEGDGEQEGEQGGGGDGSNHGGGGDGHGSGEGEGRGGTGSRGGSATARLVPVNGVRILPLDDRRELEVSFDCSESGVAHLQVDEAGDTSAIPHTDLIAFDGHGDRINLQQVCVEAGRRFRVRIRSTEPIDDRAWRVAMAIRPANDGESAEE